MSITRHPGRDDVLNSSALRSVVWGNEIYRSRYFAGGNSRE
jgi:hypothetical protein